MKGMRTKQLTFLSNIEIQKLLICILQIHFKPGDFEILLQLSAVKCYYCTEKKVLRESMVSGSAQYCFYLLTLHKIVKMQKC